MQHKAPKLTLPAIPRPDFTERQKAQWWRQHCVCMTREQLADALSYGADAIWAFETASRTKRASSKAWKRYRNACELLHIRMMNSGNKEPFNWGI